MHENRHLRQALRDRAEAAQNVTLHWNSKAATIDRADHGVTVTLDSGETLTAALLVSAEGRNSATREAAGIRVARWQYDHAAIVSTLAHERPHEGVAWEIFYPGGPFALLPMTDLDGQPPLGDRLVGGQGRRRRLPVAQRRRFRRRGAGRDGRLPRRA